MTNAPHIAAKAGLDPQNFALANCIRALAIDGVEAAKSGHPGLPMGAAAVRQKLPITCCCNWLTVQNLTCLT